MAARKPCSTGNFFGKSFPRAIGKLGDENKLVKTDDSPQLPNAPLLLWAGKADWNAGGAAPKRMGKQPKAPLSPQDAYALYLQSLVSLPSAGKDFAETAEVSEDDLTVLKHDAALEGRKSWGELSDKERKIFEDIAKEDTKRFQEEAVHYELRNPGWFAAWLQRQSVAPDGSRAAAAGGAAGRPRPPLTAWMAFVEATLARLQETHPEAAAGIKRVELMRLAMKEAAPVYKSLTAEEKAQYIKIAEEDKERYEKELAALPAEKKAKLSRKSSKKAKKTRGAAARAKKAVQENAEEQQAEERQEEEVDTTGMTALQAWAAKQRVARRAATRKSAAPTRRPRKAAQRKAAAEEGTLEEDAPAAEVEAELATLPDEAYIRTCATGDSDVSSDDEDDDDDVDISDDDDTDSAHGEPSVIADTQADEPMTQARNPNHAQPSKPIKS
ncbi:hypothetical protein COCSUDRAFT_67498 [Coccomyxa subellipsoidea C-169]|uniref:HMG box domain-containing protein n=1 Tax=Coccomyxa subellipsoidea (strain C-169) TaxID=574566 RepID=I0YP13_COCSC|nr:hypothetical protein COCSUDRAFT_67498 [Coccomyxa subellipsoidea C-169]EIE20132.1 hypothetical protein COCSUDRAFT_67498 [Coccomyxa subellipsoidea C-169]|eukprot:XP_005644676.1 hypothetical protein COCSUDRAFT_67498 [Coccomyxa subellipsoidea C-169]